MRQGTFFLSYRKLRFHTIKTLREDRTAAERKMSHTRPAVGEESCVAGFYFYFIGKTAYGALLN